jgi:CRP/FNR family transcriptional regulator
MTTQSVKFAEPVAKVRPSTQWPGCDPDAVAQTFAATSSLGSRCDVCRFRTQCLGYAFRSARTAMQPLVGYRRHLAAGEVLYHAGAKCSLVHVIQSGFFKTVTLSADGIAQITAFQMPGDVLGMDGLQWGVHCTDAIALTEASVCVISRARLLEASAENAQLCGHLLGALSSEISSNHGTMLLLGSRSAEERVAGFIVELSERLRERGYAASEIGLWMSREEIGSFLGLELETVSRVLSSLVKRRLITVDRRHLRIRDMDALREAETGHDAAAHRRASRQRACEPVAEIET